MRVLHVHVQCLCVFYCFGFSYFVMLYLMILGKRGQGISDWIQLLPSNNTGDDAEQKLLVGAVIAEEMRAAVYKETGFRCSAGIAHNKVYIISNILIVKNAILFMMVSLQAIHSFCNFR